MSTSHPLSRLRVRLTKQINKLGFMFPQIFQGCIKPPLGPDQDHRERRVGFTCIDLINSVAASLANCEAKESAEVNGLAGHWLLSHRALHKNGELHSTCPQGSRLCFAIASRFDYHR